MDILVTGGAGYLGGHVVDLLLQRGERVYILDPLLYNASVIDKFKDHPSCVWMNKSVNDPIAFRKALQNVGAVVQLAAIVGDPACHAYPFKTLLTNYFSNLLLLANTRVKRIVFTSSCSVYSTNEQGPFDLNEESDVTPSSLYARTRLWSEKALLSQVKIPVVIFRLSTLCGWAPRMRLDLVANQMTYRLFCHQKFQVIDGHRYRPFLAVRDAARAIVLALDAPESVIKHQIFNVGANDHNCQLIEMGKMLLSIMPLSHMETIRTESRDQGYAVNFAKIEQELGFKPLYSIQDCLTEMRDMLSEQRDEDWEAAKYSNVRMLATKSRR